MTNILIYIISLIFGACCGFLELVADLFGWTYATTPAHLHYGIGTLIPYPWRIDDAPLGWQKAFYLNPIDYLVE